MIVILAAIAIAALGLYVKSIKPQDIPKQLKKITNSQQNKTVPEKATSSPQIYTQNLNIPWAITFLPNGNLLATERPGTVKEIDKNGNAKTIFTVDDVKPEGEGGLHGIALHPKFAQNNYVYLYYTYNPNPTQNKVVRYKYQNGTLVQDKVILEKIPGSIFHNGGRIKFGPDGYLYITTGDAQEPSLAQNKNSLAGKILRVTDNGSPAPQNPFGNEVYSYGHRNPQGIFWDQDGTLWETEHGPSANDEINKIEIGKNYGWPDFVGNKSEPGITTPYATSGSSTWAPADIIVLNGKVYFAGLRGTAIFTFDIDNPSKVDALYKGEYGRIRELVLGPDGNIYFTTSNRDGRGLPSSNDDRIIKLSPSIL